MAKVQKRSRRAPIEQSKAEQRTRDDERRIRRELAAVRRVGRLSKQLEHAAARVELSTFSLGRELVGAKGWALVKADYLRELEEKDIASRARAEELERELATRRELKLESEPARV